jgi:hypothetical protein
VESRRLVAGTPFFESKRARLRHCPQAESMKLTVQAKTAGIVAIIAAGITGAQERRHFSPREKAFYADAQTVQFVHPGLVIAVTGATVAADGTITTQYTLSDPGGLPLDNTGVTTPGTISISFVAAALLGGQEQYTAYTTRAASGTMIPSLQQPGADSGGTLTSLGNGAYQYVFKTKAPSGFDKSATHTIGIYGSRNLTAFNLGTNYASTTFNFVPAGGNVTHTRDVIRTSSCNQCHDQLSAHGGSRRGVDLCVLCHTPQNIDPNTGLTMDFKFFIHKIHMGSQLPSVIAGGSYSITTPFGTSDYSKVVDPADPRRCAVCHQQSTGAEQARVFLTNPTRAACGSCHDDVNFASGQNHAGGPQLDDNLCATCHIPQGELPFDASIQGGHIVPTDTVSTYPQNPDPLLSGLNFSITSVTNTNAGRAPVVACSAFGPRVPFVHHGRPHHRLRLHHLWKLHQHARLRHRKRSFRIQVRRQWQLHLQLYECGSRESCRHLCDRRRGAANGGCPSRYDVAAIRPIRRAQSRQLLLRGWLAGREAPFSGSARQLQYLPRRVIAARNVAKQHRILRDMPQPLEHGRRHTRLRNQSRR